MDLYSLEVTFESGSQRTEESTGFCLASWFQCNKSRLLLFHHMFGIVMLFDVFRWMFFLLFLTCTKKSGVEKAVKVFLMATSKIRYGRYKKLV